MPGTTPVYGFPYPEPTDLVADYPALGQQLAEDVEAVLPTIGGLAPATPTSIANSGGSASLTGNTVTFSGVSSVSLNGCFTGDYDNYRVLVSFTPSASGQTFDLRLRASGTDLSTSVYSHAGVQVTTGAVVSGVAALAITNLRLSATASTTSPHATLFDIFAPRAASQKTVAFSSWRANGTSAAFVEQGAGFIASAVAHDGFSLSLSSGTITGTVSVYGYKK